MKSAPTISKDHWKTRNGLPVTTITWDAFQLGAFLSVNFEELSSTQTAWMKLSPDILPPDHCLSHVPTWAPEKLQGVQLPLCTRTVWKPKLLELLRRHTLITGSYIQRKYRTCSDNTPPTAFGKDLGMQAEHCRLHQAEAEASELLTGNWMLCLATRQRKDWEPKLAPWSTVTTSTLPVQLPHHRNAICHL